MLFDFQTYIYIWLFIPSGSSKYLSLISSLFGKFLTIPANHGPIFWPFCQAFLKWFLISYNWLGFSGGAPDRKWETQRDTWLFGKGAIFFCKYMWCFKFWPWLLCGFPYSFQLSSWIWRFCLLFCCGEWKPSRLGTLHMLLKIIAHKFFSKGQRGDATMVDQTGKVSDNDDELPISGKKHWKGWFGLRNKQVYLPM